MVYGHVASVTFMQEMGVRYLAQYVQLPFYFHQIHGLSLNLTIPSYPRRDVAESENLKNIVIR